MDVEELSMIGPTLDLTHVDGIHRKRLVAFINNFIINTAAFLNKFAKTSEVKLMQIHLKLQKIETSIILLESKLNSIPSLANNTNSVNTITPVIKEPVSTPVPETSPSPTNDPKPTDASVSDVPDTEEKKQIDETLLKYVKMLHFGVPEPAVKLKMTQEGISAENQRLIVENK